MAWHVATGSGTVGATVVGGGVGRSVAGASVVGGAVGRSVAGATLVGLDVGESPSVGDAVGLLVGVVGDAVVVGHVPHFPGQTTGIPPVVQTLNEQNSGSAIPLQNVRAPTVDGTVLGTSEGVPVGTPLGCPVDAPDGTRVGAVLVRWALGLAVGDTVVSSCGGVIPPHESHLTGHASNMAGLAHVLEGSVQNVGSSTPLHVDDAD